MATKSHLKQDDISASNSKLFSRIRTTIETAFYGNNVTEITSISQAYKLAKESPGTIVTDLPLYKPGKLELPADSKVLLFNDGIITGRQAQARRLVNKDNKEKFANILRDAIFSSRHKTMYHAVAYVGLHEDFMVKAHLLIPKGYENTMYSWMLNFQNQNIEMDAMYERSTLIEEGDIFLYSDPDYFAEGYDQGLSIFEHDTNCGALLGLRYFGEHKKGTLTMAWSVASRNDFTACHGGQKRFNLENDKTFIAGVFGLSGSGKSTITHSKHHGKFDVTVLHDDAFIISNKDGSSVSLEPSYFDKVQDYPTGHPDNKYLLTIQNVGATLDEDGRIVPVTEDIRNGNGRALKSKFWTKKRAFKFNNKVDAIFWIMKDDALPPIMKVSSPILGSAFGATLATKRSSAEHGATSSKLVIEPYANPFRLYPLRNDYNKFKDLFENTSVDCYILNTGYFLKNKVTPTMTLKLVEDIVTDELQFVPFGKTEHLSIVELEDFTPDLSDETYVELLKERLQFRVDYIDSLYNQDILPTEARDSILEIIEKL